MEIHARGFTGVRNDGKRICLIIEYRDDDAIAVHMTLAMAKDMLSELKRLLREEE